MHNRVEQSMAEQYRTVVKVGGGRSLLKGAVCISSKFYENKTKGAV